VPRLSIILTSRNRYELLQQAISSVLNQSFEDLELIVVDDDSEDRRILQYLKNIAMKDKRIKVFRGPPVNKQYREANTMNAVRINSGLVLARGEFVSYLCDDDMYLPGRCAHMVKILDAEPETGMVVGLCRWLMPEGSSKPQDFVKYGYYQPFERGHVELLKAIAPSNFICHDSVMHRWKKG